MRGCAVTLIELVTAAALALAPVDRAPAPDVDAALAGIAAAVDSDELPPLTGTREGDAVLVTAWAWHESRWRLCAPGDGGKAWGILQLQGTPMALACAPATAAGIWLSMAHAAIERCGDLSVLASGVCGRARGLVRRRIAQADALRRRVAR